MENGYIQKCVDEEFEAINNEVIDGASKDINCDFEMMLELESGDAVEDN